MYKILGIILSLPKSLYLNFKLLPIKIAIKCPIWIYYRSFFSCKGSIIINGRIRPAMIRIGFNREKHIDPSLYTILYLSKGSKLYFNGEAHIGYGSKMVLHENAVVEIGNNLNVSSMITIRASKYIAIKDNVLISWGCFIYDSDSHKIFLGEKYTNIDKPVVIDNHVWIGNDVQIMKGTYIPPNCVVASRSVVSGNNFDEYTIIHSRSRAKSITKISDWVK